MVESYGGNIPARIWARFMKAALAGTPPHDFPYPSDEVAKVAGCGRGGHEYYLKGTEPQSGCGGSIDAYGENDGYGAAASYAQPTVPPADSTPPVVVPPPPTESPTGSPSPLQTVPPGNGDAGAARSPMKLFEESRASSAAHRLASSPSVCDAGSTGVRELQRIAIVGEISGMEAAAERQPFL